MDYTKILTARYKAEQEAKAKAEALEKTTRATNSECKIISFTLLGKTIKPDYYATNITFNFDYKDLYSLKTARPTITISDKATIKPASGEKVDLTKPFDYFVTAENKLSQRYTIICKVKANDEAKLLLFILDTRGIEGVIDEVNKVVNLTLPHGFSVKQVTTLLKVSEDATVIPESLSYPIDWYNTKLIKVKSQSGIEVNYKVNLITKGNHEGKLTLFALQSGVTRYFGVLDKSNVYTITLPANASFTNVLPIFVVSDKAIITPDPLSIKDYSKDITFTVVSEDGSDKNTYIVRAKK